jgi:hypothetical protein
MKRSFYVLLASLAATSCIALPVQARQWRIFFENTAVTASIDVDSIKGVGNIRNFWVKNVYSTPKPMGYYQISSDLVRSWVDCNLRKVGNSQIVGFDKQGFKTIDSGDMKEPDDWSYVLPDTSREIMLDAVCQLRSNQSDSILQIPKQNTPQVRISQSVATDLVRQWMQAKGRIFGKSHDRRLIEKLTTGKLYQDLTNPKGPFYWLKENDAYYTYSSQEVERLKYFNEENGTLIVEAYVQESTSLFEKGELTRGGNGPNISLVRYDFSWKSGSWKLQDYNALSR